MKHLLFLICLCSFIFSGEAQNASSIDFVIRNLGINVDGHFNSFSITAKINPNTQNLESISGSIDVASIKTGIESRDEHLLEEDYFHENKYPKISLNTDNITKVSENEYRVKAKLKIKGITKKITLKVLLQKLESQYKLTSNFEINRKDFNVGGSSFIMSKTVKINVNHYQRL